MKHAVALVAAALIAASAGPAAGQAPERLDRTDWLIPGGFEPGRQPDGNSILLIGSEGAVVFDTGRHAAQTDRIEALLRKLDRPLVAIVNSHWHLDHVSGNLRLKAAHPQAQVWASDAIDEALHGFLAAGARDGRAAIDSGQLPATMAQDVEGDIATVAAGNSLRPERVVSSSGNVSLAGRTLRLNLARHAVTAGDVWIYDAARGRVLAGDLVTLPAPFLDTACPDGWKAALSDIAATKFETLVPGHGPVMNRAAFGRWRAAFTAFVDCARTSDPALGACAARWLTYAAPYLGESERTRAKALTDYYAGLVHDRALDKNCIDQA